MTKAKKKKTQASGDWVKWTKMQFAQAYFDLEKERKTQQALIDKLRNQNRLESDQTSNATHSEIYRLKTRCSDLNYAIQIERDEHREHLRAKDMELAGLRALVNRLERQLKSKKK